MTTDSFQLNSYTDEGGQILQSFANHAAVAIYNARLFDEALQARKEAEVANQAKSEFLGRVSHELRTPLHIIMGMAYIAKEDELTQRQHKCLKDVQKASKRLLRLINEILDFSKLETGKIRVEHRLFRVDELLTNLLSRHQKHVERELLTLALRVEGSVPYALLGDPAHLEQVLDNLLDNAVKFTRDDEIVLSVLRMEDAEAAAADRIILCFSLSDTGIGIAPEQIGGIFAPFHQVDGSNTRTYGGTGLGLTLCRRLVDMMGGEIRAESILGQGSTVTFTLPFGEHKGPALVELAQPACMLLEEKNSLADETRSVSTPWGPALIPLLDHLVELLDDEDMEAEEYAASLETHFQGTPFEEKRREVLNLIAVYNFEKALVVLQGLIGVLEQTTFPSSAGKCYSRNDVR